MSALTLIAGMQIAVAFLVYKFHVAAAICMPNWIVMAYTLLISPFHHMRSAI
jgi:hypothetical protein